MNLAAAAAIIALAITGQPKPGRPHLHCHVWESIPMSATLDGTGHYVPSGAPEDVWKTCEASPLRRRSLRGRT